MAHLFRAGGAYSAYRPTYPAELYERILKFAGLDGASAAPQRQLAVDVATGSGQAARELAARFERVIAIDGSPQQLEHAPKDTPNIEFRVADAHETGLPAGCADLVAVAQALHWFDTPAFYREARRVLRPETGALAAWCYGLAVVEREGHAADEAMRDVYEGKLGPYWDERRRLVERMYEGLEPVQGVDFACVERRLFDMRHEVTVDGLVGYVSSWSSYNSYKAEHGEEAGQQLLSSFRDRVLGALGAGATGDSPVTLVTPIALLLAKGPLSVGAE